MKTPCVGICSTGIGDSVCRGCKRFAHEVIDWNSYTEEQRKFVFRRLEDFLAKVVDSKLEVVDVSLLREQLEHQKIRYNRQQDPRCWAYELLRAGARQITQLDVYGLKVSPEWEGSSLTEIKQAIEEHFYRLSCVHYERYFEPAVLVSHA